MGSPGDAFLDISQALTGMNFKLTEDTYDEQAFGSRYAIYQRNLDEVRLVWDGREEWLLLETRGEGEKAWKELWIERIGRATAGAANIEALRSALMRRVA